MSGTRQVKVSKSGESLGGSKVNCTAGEDFGTSPDSLETDAISSESIGSESTSFESASDGQDSELKSRQNEIYIRAVKLLARREHSYFELVTKLDKAGYESDLIAAVLERLINKGFQSDARFAELYVEQRFNKGYGQRDIVANLTRRGIDRHLAARTLADFESAKNINWYEHAASVLAQRFNLSAHESATANADTDASALETGEETLSVAAEDRTAQERRSQAREQAADTQRTRKRWGNYLLRRGFSNDQVISAIDSAWDFAGTSHRR